MCTLCPVSAQHDSSPAEHTAMFEFNIHTLLFNHSFPLGFGIRRRQNEGANPTVELRSWQDQMSVSQKNPIRKLMAQLYFLPIGSSPLLKPENSNKQDYHLYFALHADFIVQKQRGNYWVDFDYVVAVGGVKEGLCRQPDLPVRHDQHRDSTSSSNFWNEVSTRTIWLILILKQWSNFQTW